MTDLTDQLDAIQARADAATPGAITITPSDIADLLVLAREQQAAIDAVRVLVHDDTLADGLVMHAVNPEAIREALEAKP